MFWESYSYGLQSPAYSPDLHPMTAEEAIALRLSLLVGTTSVVLSLPFTVALAYLFARKQFPGKWLFETLVDLPLVLPPVVTGYLLLVALGPRGWVGGWLTRWGLPIVFTWRGAAVASAVVSFPLMVRAIRLAFQAVDPRLELAARSLGAGPLDCFLTVTLPLARRGVIAGCLLGFARSLGEFGATVMVAANISGETRTIPLAIYSIANRPGGLEQTWRLVIVSIVLASGALILGDWFERRQVRHESA